MKMKEIGLGACIPITLPWICQWAVIYDKGDFCVVGYLRKTLVSSLTYVRLFEKQKADRKIAGALKSLIIIF